MHRLPHRRPPLLAPPLLAVLLAAAASAPAGAAVSIAIDRPLDGDIVVSPVTIDASALTDAAGARIASWQVYVDGVQAYGTAGPTRAISTSLSMDDGRHELIVQAWDSTGSYGSESLTLTIGICSGFIVELQLPTAGSQESPVHVAAVASSCHRITGFAVYVDDQRVYRQGGSTSLDASLDIPAGSHSLEVRATDATRSTASSGAVPIDVEAPAPARPSARPGQPVPARPPAQPPPPPR